MIVGLPKEIKDNENRVGLVPAGVQALDVGGPRGARRARRRASGSGIPDEQYVGRGREDPRRRPTRSSREAEMIVKVKEPVGPEYQRLRAGPDPLHVPPPRARPRR